MRIRSRREEGQVYPALLLAVIGGFAIAVSFIPLQNLLDQTGRADTAADAAALAAAKGHEKDFMFYASKLPDSPAKVALFLAMLSNHMARAQIEAGKLAESNGATVDQLTSRPFDLARGKKIYTVITRQQDTVKGGSASANSKSRASAAAEVHEGLCFSATGYGVDITGPGCKSAFDWTYECTPTPVNTPPPYCYAGIDFTLKLKWKIYLVKNDDFF